MLNPKQKRFCEEYVKDSNGAQSYIRAGYSPNGARECASRLLSKDNISQYVDILRAKITGDGILEAKEIQTLLSDRIRVVLDNDGLKAVDILNKMQGNYTTDKEPGEDAREYRFVNV